MTELSQLSQPQNNTWFVASQPAWIQNGIVPEWFYWRISRKAAEDLLMCKPPGSFLIRVSESRAGYTLSYRAEGRFRHFMIDAKGDGSCVIVGERCRHPSLQQLVDFHRKVPIAAHNEVLTFPCRQAPNVGNKSSGNSSVQSSKSHITSKEPQDDQNNDEKHSYTRPAMAPNVGNKSSGNSSVQSSKSHIISKEPQNNDESHSHTRPAMPVPKSRRRYITDIALPAIPLETPSKNLLTAPSSEVAPTPPVEHHDETNTKRNTPLESEEVQETWEQLFDAVLSGYNDEGESLPQEYSPPPPFAPGYQT